MLQRLGDRGLPSPGLTWERLQSAKPARTGVLSCPQDAPPGPSPWAARHLSSSPGLVDGLRRRLLPAWCAPLAHGLSLLLVAVAVGVSGWVGAGFSPGVGVMWLLSSSSSFLASFFGWEPLKVSGTLGGRAASPWRLWAPLTPPLAQVLLEALYFSLVAKRLHPDEDDTLVESPAVTPVSERVPRVRPPHGFALFLAKEEARKVKKLHGMLRVSRSPVSRLAETAPSCGCSLGDPARAPCGPLAPAPAPLTPSSRCLCPAVPLPVPGSMSSLAGPRGHLLCLWRDHLSTPLAGCWRVSVPPRWQQAPWPRAVCWPVP